MLLIPLSAFAGDKYSGGVNDGKYFTLGGSAADQCESAQKHIELNKWREGMSHDKCVKMITTDRRELRAKIEKKKQTERSIFIGSVVAGLVVAFFALRVFIRFTRPRVKGWGKKTAVTANVATQPRWLLLYAVILLACILAVLAVVAL